MKPVKIHDHLTVAGQPDAKTLAALGKKGFSCAINIRPDGEAPDQLCHKVEGRTLRKQGLSYHFIPVTRQTITRADIQAFQQAMAAARGPVFAHCGSGVRALSLYVIGEVLDGRMKRDDVLAFGRSHGFDLSDAAAWLEDDSEQMPKVEGFFDPRTWSIQYVVSDPVTKHCAIIDPIYDYDEKSGSTSTFNADAILAYIEKEGLTVEWILDTHPHADHLSAARYLKKRTGAPMGIGSHVTDIQKLWRGIYNLPDAAVDGSQWDHLFAGGDHFRIGSLEGTVLFSPGHTLASVTYVIGNAAFVHDTLFVPDSGTARADFPGGNARTLWHSIQNILSLPDETRLFTGHDYQPGGRHPRWESTVGEQKRLNPHIADRSEHDFVTLREERDRALPMPRLILHALQVNAFGCRLPEPEDNGQRYLKIPLNALDGSAW